ncbi:MAG: DNA repair protein RadC [Geminicoccaceae bacterium]|nr:DNA repair protein RadC [Geminicoccaceae bacterium]MCX8100851.1 DNA repair protein RadC [Geminicoccaceae bacterium]MDW8370516.1 DNA repair protein RadC [Geminicoccaceae bacterium]
MAGDESAPPVRFGAERAGPDEPGAPCGVGLPAADALAARGLELRPAAEGGFLLTGYTFHYKEAIKRAGGRWLAERRAWHLPEPRSLDALASLLAGPPRADGLAEAPAAPIAPPAALPSPAGGSWGSKHYHGHRERLRQRLLDAGPEALADYELLELLLFFSVYRRDTKPLAKEMLQRFGSLGGVLAADPARYAECFELAPLAAEAGSQRAAQRDEDLRFTRVLLKAVHVLLRRVLKEEIRDRPVIGSWSALLDYLRATLGHEPTEQFRILFLDRKNILIRDEPQSRGTVDHTPLYPREVVKRALELGASAIVMVHNHPSGDPTPSKPDIETTRAVVQALAAVGILVHDHVIVGKNRHLSFRSEGLL